MARAESPKQLTALEHLHELWLRLLTSVAVIFIGGGLAFVFRLQIINFLQHPLHEKLYYNSPMGSFQFIMQVCLLVGIILALPILMYNLIRFVEPAFEKHFSHRLLLVVLGASLLLAGIGVAFGYYLTLPFALHFFQSVGSGALLPLISVNEYFSFILGYLATFAVVFQLPLLLLFMNHVTPFKPGGLRKWRKHVYIGAFAISLIMPSSPDPLSQVSLAIPIIVLYECSLFLIWRVNRAKNRAAPAAQSLHETRIEGTENATDYAPTPAMAQPASADSVSRGKNIDGVMAGSPTRFIASVQRGQYTTAGNRNVTRRKVWYRQNTAPGESVPGRAKPISDIL